MKMFKSVINYIKDENFKIIYVNNSVNVINYDNILEVKSDVVTLEKEKKLLFIKGNDLRFDKLLENEILITGCIHEIDI